MIISATRPEARVSGSQRNSTGLHDNTTRSSARGRLREPPRWTKQGSVAESRAAFEHSTPVLYDRYMGPLLFEPWAKLVAERAAFLCSLTGFLRPRRLFQRGR